MLLEFGLFGFFACFLVAQSPNHEPYQRTADIDEPRPPRRMEGDENKEGDEELEEDEKVHIVSYSLERNADGSDFSYVFHNAVCFTLQKLFQANIPFNSPSVFCERIR